jgi:hypothetical protein
VVICQEGIAFDSIGTGRRTFLAPKRYVVFSTVTETENWALGIADKVASLKDDLIPSATWMKRDQ